MFRTLTLFLALTAISTATAQQEDSSYYIDVLIDADKNIYFGNTKVALEAVPETVRSRVDNLKYVEGKGITYRIFGDEKLKLGDIMNLQNMMHKGFTQPKLTTKRYLLKAGEIPLDKSNWIDQINKLDLKAI